MEVESQGVGRKRPATSATVVASPNKKQRGKNNNNNNNKQTSTSSSKNNTSSKAVANTTTTATSPVRNNKKAPPTVTTTAATATTTTTVTPPRPNAKEATAVDTITPQKPFVPNAAENDEDDDDIMTKTTPTTTGNSFALFFGTLLVVLALVQWDFVQNVVVVQTPTVPETLCRTIVEEYHKGPRTIKDLTARRHFHKPLTSLLTKSVAEQEAWLEEVRAVRRKEAAKAKPHKPSAPAVKQPDGDDSSNKNHHHVVASKIWKGVGDFLVPWRQKQPKA